MMTFEEYGDELRAFLSESLRPEPKVTYYAYKAGTARSYPTLEAARDYSSITERVVDRAAVLEWELKRDELCKKQFDAWKADLRIEFIDLSDRQFERLYEKADGLSTSYAQMENIMGEWYRVFYG